MPMLGFDLQISGVGGDRFVNYATTTVQVKDSLLKTLNNFNNKEDLAPLIE